MGLEHGHRLDGSVCLLLDPLRLGPDQAPGAGYDSAPTHGETSSHLQLGLRDVVRWVLVCDGLLCKCSPETNRRY